MFLCLFVIDDVLSLFWQTLMLTELVAMQVLLVRLGRKDNKVLLEFLG